MLLAFETFGHAKNHGEKFTKLSQNSSYRIVYSRNVENNYATLLTVFGCYGEQILK